MNQQQQTAIKKLYLRDKHSLPRTGLRLKITRDSDKPTLDKRKEISSITDMQKFCVLNTDIFLSLFSEDQIKSKEYDCIFLDIDDPIPRMAYVKLMLVCTKLMENNIKYTVLQSGSKGYHVYVKFNKVVLSSYRECVINWLRDLEILDNVDTNAIDTRRVTRIPYSNNSKGNTCIPLGNDVYDISLAPVEKPLELFTNPMLHLTLKKFDQSENRMKMGGVKEGVKSEIFKSREYFPECMGMLVDEALSGTDLGHVERVELGKFLIHVYGGDLEKIKTYYTKMSDYKERNTMYQLNHLKKKGYKMMNCKSLMDNGLCPVEEQCECPFNPSINWIIKKERLA